MDSVVGALGGRRAAAGQHKGQRCDCHDSPPPHHGCTIPRRAGGARDSIHLKSCAADAGSLPLSEASATAVPRPPRFPERLRQLPGSALAAAVVGTFFGVSPLFGGLYDLRAWGPIGIVALVGLISRVIASKNPLPRGTGWAGGALLLLAGIQFASSAWAESIDRALTDAHRTLFLAASFVLVCVLAQRRESRLAVVAGVAVGTLVVALVVAVRLLPLDLPDGFFVSGRLYGPLGYTNGQAAAMLLGFWPLVAMAERLRSPVAAGAALSLAALSLYLSLLTQSRGALAALGVSALLMVAFVPGRVRRMAVLLPLAAGVAAVLPTAIDAYESAPRATGIPDADLVHNTVLLAAVAAAGVGLLGAALLRFGLPLRLEGKRPPVGAVCVAVVAAVAAGAPGALERAWDNFRSLEPVPVQSRLASGGGNRYDYWRVAVKEWAAHPIEGVGAGNYYRDYFLERRNLEDIRQPHSLEFQVLAETGLLGGAALLGFIANVLLAATRAHRRSDLAPTEMAIVIGAAGTFLLWLLHTSVDWLHLLPGVTGAALACAAVLVTAGARPSTTPRRPEVAVRPLLFAGALIAVASLGVLVLADRYRTTARDAVRSDPLGALDRGRDSFELNNHSVPTLFTIAAAQARLNRYANARSTLERAEELEPHNWVAPALLGDLEMRRRNFRVAAASYARAARLNPRSSELKKLRRTARNGYRVLADP
jgi:O-antigen ligase